MWPTPPWQRLNFLPERRANECDEGGARDARGTFRGQHRDAEDGKLLGERELSVRRLRHEQRGNQ